MPANQSLGVRDNCKIETAIREIDVSAGFVVLSSPGGDVFKVYADGEPKVFDPPQSGFDCYSPFGARFHLTYETDPVGTEEARDQGPKKRRSSSIESSSQPRRKRSNPKSKSKGSASKSGKVSASGSSRKGGSRASKSASSTSGARKRSSTSSQKKRS